MGSLLAKRVGQPKERNGRDRGHGKGTGKGKKNRIVERTRRDAAAVPGSYACGDLP